jgi:hypothetical protein
MEIRFLDTNQQVAVETTVVSMGTRIKVVDYWKTAHCCGIHKCPRIRASNKYFVRYRNAAYTGGKIRTGAVTEERRTKSEQYKTRQL